MSAHGAKQGLQTKYNLVMPKGIFVIEKAGGSILTIWVCGEFFAFMCGYYSREIDRRWRQASRNVTTIVLYSSG